jgi:NAD(P)-dependent dehydrogenase (short-subunit alcohol dehydrogenase family)
VKGVQWAPEPPSEGGGDGGGHEGVNTVAPGPTRTEAAIDMLGDTVEQMGTQAPLGRAAHPTEIAEAIVFLASPWASYLSGATVPVDGGRSAV